MNDFKIVLLGHLGVGSIFGMITRGNEQNRFQRWLRNEAWEKAKTAVGVPGTYPDILVIGGEVGEGQNRLDFCEDIWLPDYEKQSMMGAELISEWIGENTKEVLILYAHRYHGMKEIRFEDLLAKDLKILHPNKKILVGTQFIRSYFGKTLRFRHGTSGAFVYLSSANERQIKFNLIEYSLGKTPKYDFSYEFHNHRAAGAMFETIGSMWCPCFKLIDRYAELRHPDAWLPDIGLLAITFQVRFGDVRVNNDPILFYPPFRFEDLETAIRDFNKVLEEKRKETYKRQLELLKKDTSCS